MSSDAASLDRLRDIVVPAPAPWWPPAPGWYWVLGAVLLATILLAVRFLICWQQNSYRREALAQLSRLERTLHDPARRAAALTAFAELLKRAALSVWPRGKVASLTGSTWVAFLESSGATKAGFAETIERVAYDPGTVSNLNETQVRELAAQVRDWLKHHRAETRG
jgi:Domain of unknown function (DUF4381)